jgi:predicted nucleotidyltransferase
MFGLENANYQRCFSKSEHCRRQLEAFLTMRLTDDQIQVIRQLACQVTGSSLCSVRVFGSRLDDTARGGDLDLMIELPKPVDNPALMAAQMSAKVSRVMHGRKVDVLLSAPSLMHLPIHDIAFTEGRLL